jgi:uncharacterized membrane protein
MKTDRLMAFTDGVLAIAITIMVLDLRVPATPDWQSIQPVIPLLVAYALAFINIGIFWTNHHHMLATASRVNGRALWANLFLLFWLTLMPFVIRWIGLAGVTPQPVAAYGVVTVMAAFGYMWLERELILAEGTESRIRAWSAPGRRNGPVSVSTPSVSRRLSSRRGSPLRFTSRFLACG